MRDQLSDPDEERLVAQLREALGPPEELPDGMAARLAAGVAHARRRERRGWEGRLVVACLVFFLAGSAYTAVPMPALGVLALFYAWLLPLRAEEAASPPA